MRVRTALDLGLVIRERRRALGLGQGALAKQVGVSRQWLIEVEHGKARAEIGLLLRTLNALNLEIMIAPSDTGPPEAAPIPEFAIDINAVIDRARGRLR